MGGCKYCGKYACFGECSPTCQVCGIGGGIYAGGTCGSCYNEKHGPVSATNKSDVEQLLWKMKNGEEFNIPYPSGMGIHTNKISSLALQHINTGQLLDILHSLNVEYIWGVSLHQKQSFPIAHIHYTVFSSGPYPICKKCVSTKFHTCELCKCCSGCTSFANLTTKICLSCQKTPSFGQLHGFDTQKMEKIKDNLSHPITFDDLMGKIEADLKISVPVPPSTPPSLVEHPPYRCSTSTCWCQLSMWYLHRPAPCPVPTRPEVV